MIKEEKSEEQYRRERLTYLVEHKISPYPHKFEVDTTFAEFTQKYNEIEDGNRHPEHTHRMAGRIREKRSFGNKLYFYTVDSDGLTVQFLVDKREFGDPDNFKTINKAIHRGDLVGVVGFPCKSKKGELSIIPRKMQLLSICTKYLPKQIYGLTDPEIRARKRYLDLIVNGDSRQTFVMRSRIFSAIRRFLEDHEFLEVQTPVLSLQAGGASAKPFVTYHNDLKQNMFMRVAPELFLKECVVGGLNRVFEIGPQFRNESIDRSHLPEFQSIEWYWAYADYYDNMDLCELMLAHLMENIHGKMQLDYLQYGRDEPVTIDFTPPFKRIDIVPALEEKLGVCLPENMGTEKARQILDDLCVQFEVDCGEPRTNNRLLDKLIGQFLEQECVNPTFLINHPLIMCPLAKWHREKPYLSERFELFVNGMELANAYTELNDPAVQRIHFEEQAKAKAAGDDEAQSIDENFIEALQYGLPPTSGFGMGLDRLVMIMTNRNNIRDVTLFPAMAIPE